jgi:hypothetical protein
MLQNDEGQIVCVENEKSRIGQHMKMGSDMSDARFLLQNVLGQFISVGGFY